MRDGALAVRLAEKCRDEGEDRVELLDILAAAYAEAGRFEEAVRTARSARELAGAPDSDLARAIDERRKSYEAKKPWRERR